MVFALYYFVFLHYVYFTFHFEEATLTAPSTTAGCAFAVLIATVMLVAKSGKDSIRVDRRRNHTVEPYWTARDRHLVTLKN